jgi:hypothetical protein
VWNNAGVIFIEITVSMTIFFLLGISSLTVFQLEANQTSRILQEWQAYWILQKTAERWKTGELIRGNEEVPAGFEMELHENPISPKVQEGEFIIRWKTMGVENEKSGLAYRMALPSSNF